MIQNCIRNRNPPGGTRSFFSSPSQPLTATQPKAQASSRRHPVFLCRGEASTQQFAPTEDLPHRQHGTTICIAIVFNCNPQKRRPSSTFFDFSSFFGLCSTTHTTAWGISRFLSALPSIPALNPWLSRPHRILEAYSTPFVRIALRLALHRHRQPSSRRTHHEPVHLKHTASNSRCPKRLNVAVPRATHLDRRPPPPPCLGTQCSV